MKLNVIPVALATTDSRGRRSNDRLLLQRCPLHGCSILPASYRGVPFTT